MKWSISKERRRMSFTQKPVEWWMLREILHPKEKSMQRKNPIEWSWQTRTDNPSTINRSLSLSLDVLLLRHHPPKSQRPQLRNTVPYLACIPDIRIPIHISIKCSTVWQSKCSLKWGTTYAAYNRTETIIPLKCLSEKSFHKIRVTQIFQSMPEWLETFLDVIVNIWVHQTICKLISRATLSQSISLLFIIPRFTSSSFRLWTGCLANCRLFGKMPFVERRHIHRFKICAGFKRNYVFRWKHSWKIK